MHVYPGDALSVLAGRNPLQFSTAEDGYSPDIIQPCPEPYMFDINLDRPPRLPVPIRVSENPRTDERVPSYPEIPFKVPANHDVEKRIKKWGNHPNATR